MWKLQATATINLKIPLLNTDGTPAIGETTGLFTKIIAPDGTLVSGYTEATFTEPNGDGVYNTSFTSTSPTKAFLLEDQPNPYSVTLDSSTANVDPMTIDVWLVSIYPWEVAKEATLNSLNNFDPANDTVANVTTVATTTTNTDMRGTDSAALATTLSTHETNRDAMETTLQTEHGLLESGIANIGSGISRIQTSLVDQVLVSSGNNWIKVVVLVNDSNGALFDPADIIDPSGPQAYDNIGAKFTDINDDQVIMYKDNVGTPLDQVTLCAHAPQSNKPQLLERDGHGLYYYWMNATAIGDVLPVGQLKAVFGLFDITQTEATYSGTSPFLIQDTDPSAHLHILFAIAVLAETGTNERLDGIIVDIADHETARATMQSRAEGTGYDPAQNSLKNIKDSIG